MDTVKKLNEHFLSCNICTEIYKDPCTIGCYHTFCRECLTKYTKTRREAITAKSILCPNCRQMTRVPNPQEPVERWSHQFKPSFLIQGLLDTFISEKSTGQETVDNCCYSCKKIGENSTAASHCHDCDIQLCKRCSKLHTTLSTHLVVDMNDKNVARRRRVLCKEHNVVVEFCCKDCKKVVCQKCCIVYHRKCHSVVTLESMMSEMKESLQQNFIEIDTHLQETDTNLTKHRSQVEEVGKHKGSLQSEIRRVSQQAVDLIKEKEKNLMEELEELTEKQTEQLRAQIKCGEIDQQTYQQYSEYIKQVLQSENLMDLYDMYEMCQSGEITPGIGAKQTSGSLSKKISFRKKFDVCQAKKSLQLGHLESGADFSLHNRPNLFTTIDITSKEDIGTPDPVDIVVLDIKGVDTMVVTDFRNACLKSYYTKESQVLTRSLKLKYKPFCVKKLNKDKVIVSFLSSNSFEKVQVTPDLVHLSSIPTQKEYRGLTVLSEETLAAGCNSPPSVDILDLSGKVLRSVITQHTGQGLIQNPWFMCTTNKGHILVSDLKLGSVFCVTPNGEVVFTYTLAGQGAYGVTTTDTGDILVADSRTNKILHLTETGQHVRDLLILQDGINRPQGICLHKDKLYVAQCQEKIRVFQSIT